MPHSDELNAGDVLAVENLNIAFMQDQQKIAVVRNLSFSLQRGETLAIVGESGSGKSVTALALMRLLEQAGGLVQCDKMLLRRRSREVIELSEQSAAQMRHVRGADMAMIFQEPMTSLNPVFTVGEQIAESIRLHQNASREEAMVEAKRMLDQVRIPEAQTILSRYPHQLSGGMRQRVMIAMALSCRPAVLIADEPTTALDVTIQAQILQLIKVLQKEMSMGVIFITHDMGVVAEIADRVLVMYQGEAVETGSVEQIFHAPHHPYTRALLAAVPQLGAMKGLDYPRRFPLISLEHPAKQEPPIEQKTVVDGEPVLRVRNLVTRFPLRSGLLNRVTREVHAVEKVSFDLWPGETLSTQQQLAQVGIKAQVTAMDAGQRAAEVEGKGQKESGVRMFYTGWSASTGEADWALSPLFASQNWPPTLFNTAFYSNKQVDDFLAQALKTNDPAEKTRLYKAAQDIIWQESPWIPLVVEKLVSAHSKNLTGFWIMPDTGFSFEDADLQ